MKYIPISLGLLLRICKAFIAMQAQGAVCPDPTLLEDLDTELNSADQLPDTFTASGEVDGPDGL